MRESQLAELRKEYPVGTRVVLIKMDDIQENGETYSNNAIIKALAALRKSD